MTARTFALLPRYQHMARHWLDAPGQAVAPRRAATIMLLRPTTHPLGGLDTFVLHRAATMAFAPNVQVFPGGGVHEADAHPDLPWAGPTAAHWAATLGEDDATARALVAAACRETFEECGVLLAAPTQPAQPTRWPGDTERADLDARRITLAHVLTSHGLSLRTDQLRAHSRWITPEFESRRYDATFFLAALPPGQDADDRTTEAVTAAWHPVRQLLRDAAAGRATLLPPTLVSLETIADAATVDEALARPATMRPICPTLSRDGDLIVEQATL